jgi:hypothetical protein
MPAPAPPDPNSKTAPDPFPGSAGFWMLALALGIAISAISVFQDSENRGDIEEIIQRTAVEDRNYFPFEDRDLIPIRYTGAPLIIRSPSPDPMPDSGMIREGLTEDSKYRLYIPVERLNGERQTGGPSWYLKTGPGHFVRVTR